MAKYKIETRKFLDGNTKSKLTKDGVVVGNEVHTSPGSAGGDYQRKYQEIITAHKETIEAFGLEKIATTFSG